MVKFVNEFDAAKAAEALEPAFAVIDPASHQYPASFGTDMAREFLLADDTSSNRVQLNGGAYGATPAIVIDAAAAIRKLMDRDPDHFIEDLLPHAYTHAATELAREFGLAGGDEGQLSEGNYALTFNISTALPTVLNSIFGRETVDEDEVLLLSLNFAPVAGGVEQFCASKKIKVSRIDLTLPLTDDEIVARVESFVDSRGQRQLEHSNGVKLAIVDAITSVPGVRLPFERITHAFQTRGIRVFIDGAHAAGQIRLKINPSSATTDGDSAESFNPDYLAVDLHKWYQSPRGTCFFYIRREHHHDIRNVLFTAKNAYNSLPNHDSSSSPPASLLETMFWPGSNDYSNLITAVIAKKWRQHVSDSTASTSTNLIDYIHDLAVKGGDHVAKALGTNLLQVSESQIAAMVNIRLPLPSGFTKDSPDLDKTMLSIQSHLRSKDRILVRTFKYNGDWYVRLCAQVYNKLEDFEHAAIALCEFLGISKDN